MWLPAVPDGHKNIQQLAGSQEGQQHDSTSRDPKTHGMGGLEGSPLLSRDCKHDSGDIRAKGCWDRGTSGMWEGGRELPPVLAGTKGWAGHRTASARPQDRQSLSECRCPHVSAQGWRTSDTRVTSLGCASSLLSPQAGLGEAQDRGNGPKIAQEQQSWARATAGGSEVTSGRARPALWWLWLGHGMGTRRG